MRIISWEHTLDSHRYSTWMSIEEICKEPILHVLSGPKIINDNSRGLTDIDFDRLQLNFLPKKRWISRAKCILENYRDDIHYFTGFLVDKRFWLIILYALRRGIRVIIAAESYATVPVGYSGDESYFGRILKVLSRPIVYKLFVFSTKISRSKYEIMVMPFSLTSKNQLIQAGFVERQIYPFGYFVNKIYSHSPILPSVENLGYIKLAFFGVFIYRKGLDVLIKSIEYLRSIGMDVRLDLFGSGNPYRYIYPEQECVNYKGELSKERVQVEVRKYHAVVLPSRHDGWGVVVNESLLQGVPVIVSNNVGAKCLVENGNCGLVFKNEDYIDLANKILRLATEPMLLDKLRKSAAIVSNKITPNMAAKYFISAIQSHFYSSEKRPNAIWATDAHHPAEKTILPREI